MRTRAPARSSYSLSGAAVTLTVPSRIVTAGTPFTLSLNTAENGISTDSPGCMLAGCDSVGWSISFSTKNDARACTGFREVFRTRTLPMGRYARDWYADG